MEKPYLNNRYWEERKRFVTTDDREKTISSYIQMLKKLGFIVSSKNPNYTAGKRINDFDENGKPSWVSGYTTEFYPYIGKTNKKIISNFRKHLFVTDRNIGIKKYPIELIPDGILDDAAIISKNLRGCVNTYGLLQKNSTNIITWDIDKQLAAKYGFSSTFEILELLLKYLRINVKDLLLVEYNKYDEGGLHVYFKAGNGYQYYNRENFGLFIREATGFDIEYNFTKNVLRLPFSYEYRPIRLTKFGKILNQIRNGLKITDDCFYKNLDDAIQSVDEEKEAIDDKKCLYLANDWVKASKENTLSYGRSCFLKFKLLLSEHEAQIKKKLIKEAENKRGYKYSSFFNKEDFIKQHTFSEGQSWETMQYVVPYLKGRGFSCDEVFSMFEKMDNGSKFFGKENHKAYERIENWYNHACSANNVIKFENYRNDYFDFPIVSEDAVGWKVGYIENIQNVKEKDKEMMEKHLTGLFIYNRFIEAAKMLLEDSTITSSLRKTCNAVLKEKYKEQLIHQLPTIVLELIGKYAYDKKYKNNRGQARGLQIPEILMNRILQFANVGFSEKGTHLFNGKQFRIILLRMFGLCPVTNKEEGRVYSTHHCTVWNNTDTIDVFENFLTDLYVFYSFYVTEDEESVAFEKAIDMALKKMVYFYGKYERQFYGGKYLLPKYVPPNDYLKISA